MALIAVDALVLDVLLVDLLKVFRGRPLVRFIFVATGAEGLSFPAGLGRVAERVEVHARAAEVTGIASQGILSR